MTASEVLWQSTRNLLDSQVNLDKLYDAFDRVECKEDDLIIECDDGSYRGADWVRPVWNAYFKVLELRSRQKKGLGYITLAVQLTCAQGIEGAWKHGRQAKVLAGYWPTPRLDYCWEFDTDHPDGSGTNAKCSTHDFRWVHDEDKGRWFFAVQLETLDSTEAVDEYLVKPLRALIRDGAPKEVLGPIKKKLCRPPKKT